MSAGSFHTVSFSVLGSKRTIAFKPLSVIHAALSGPWTTPCGAEPSPSGTCRILPVFGSRMPSAPCRCAVYQMVPSGAGATSWTRAPSGSWNIWVLMDAGSAAQAGAAISNAANATIARKNRMAIPPSGQELRNMAKAAGARKATDLGNRRAGQALLSFEKHTQKEPANEQADACG